MHPLQRLNEFLLGPEPDFRTMSSDQVREYLEQHGVDYQRVLDTIQIIRARIQEELTL
jgi:hypothetical protein